MLSSNRAPLSRKRGEIKTLAGLFQSFGLEPKRSISASQRAFPALPLTVLAMVEILPCEPVSLAAFVAPQGSHSSSTNIS